MTHIVYTKESQAWKGAIQATFTQKNPAQMGLSNVLSLIFRQYAQTT